VSLALQTADDNAGYIFLNDHTMKTFHSTYPSIYWSEANVTSTEMLAGFGCWVMILFVRVRLGTERERRGRWLRCCYCSWHETCLWWHIH